MKIRMVSDEEWADIEAEGAAWRDFFDRLARDDADSGFYLPGQPRPRLSWWRRVFPPRRMPSS